MNNVTPMQRWPSIALSDGNRRAMNSVTKDRVDDEVVRRLRRVFLGEAFLAGDERPIGK